MSGTGGFIRRSLPLERHIVSPVGKSSFKLCTYIQNYNFIGFYFHKQLLGQLLWLFRPPLSYICVPKYSASSLIPSSDHLGPALPLDSPPSSFVFNLPLLPP